MAKYNDMFNDKYTYLDLHLMFEEAVQEVQDAEVYDKVAKYFYDKYGWKDEFFDDCMEEFWTDSVSRMFL